MRTKRDGTPDRRGNLANLKPVQSGEVVNPKRTNQYTSPDWPFTEAIRALAHELLPEHLLPLGSKFESTARNN